MTKFQKVFLLLVFSFGIIVGFWPVSRQHTSRQIAAVAHPQPVSAVANPRANYPFSLVPYGVQSVGDFRAALAADSALAEHYRNFDFQHASLVKMDHDSCAYVSFRRAGKIAWTQHCIPIHRGEAVLTDARYTVRGICGNQISYRPQNPTAPVDISELGPPPAALADPAVLPADGLDVASAMPPASALLPVAPSGVTPTASSSPLPGSSGSPTTAGGTPAVPVAGGGSPCCGTTGQPPKSPTPPKTPPVNVPESGYAGMLILTVIALGAGVYVKIR